MSKTEAKKIVKRYVNKLKDENYPFQAVYLFGSSAQGKAERTSDIDVAVVSKKLNKNWNQNEDELWRHTLDVDSRLEPIGFTPEDFKNLADPMVYQIRKTGIRVA